MKRKKNIMHNINAGTCKSCHHFRTISAKQQQRNKQNEMIIHTERVETNKFTVHVKI